MVSGDIIGYLTLNNQQPAIYREAEAKLVQAFANSEFLQNPSDATSS